MFRAVMEVTRKWKGAELWNWSKDYWRQSSDNNNFSQRQTPGGFIKKKATW